VNPSRRLTLRARKFIAGAVVAASLTIPVGVAATPAGASSSAAFCQTVMSFITHPVLPPGKFTVANYHTWAQKVTPLYQKLENTAPNAKVKAILAFVVTMLKYYSTTSNYNKMFAYYTSHQKQYAGYATALANAFKACLG